MGHPETPPEAEHGGHEHEGVEAEKNQDGEIEEVLGAFR
jgi:hypothetical protein